MVFGRLLSPTVFFFFFVCVRLDQFRARYATGLRAVHPDGHDKQSGRVQMSIKNENNNMWSIKFRSSQY